MARPEKNWYGTAMNQTQVSIYGQMLDSVGRCFTPDVAARIAEIRASAEVQERLEYLAERCNEGQLTEEEKDEYESCVHVINFISILQAKARKIRSGSAPG